MEASGCGTLVVLDRHKVAGILTDRDIVLALARTNHSPATVAVKEAMTRNVYVCSPDEIVSSALTRMGNARIRRLPVVDADGRVEGVVSIDDIVLWGIHRGGITRGELVEALRAICAAHQPMFETEESSADVVMAEHDD
jgi:signal-transduction protein with cAMP-binding, CBS, and nucleotidyltransferase domain